MRGVAAVGYDLVRDERRSDETPLQTAACGRVLGLRSSIILGAVLAGFIALQLWLPLGTAIKIGADEDYELSKATLCNHGYRLYTQIWDDQPPLVTFIIADLLKHFSNSVLAPRLLTVGMSLVLLSGVFFLIRSVSGLVPAAIGTAMLVASPGFMELSSSVMQEIPGLAPVVAALCMLWVGPRNRWRGTEIVAGLIFGFGLQMKMIGAAYLPIAGLMLWLRESLQVHSNAHGDDKVHPSPPPTRPEPLRRAGRPSPLKRREGESVTAGDLAGALDGIRFTERGRRGDKVESKDRRNDGGVMAPFQGLGVGNGVIPGALPRAPLCAAFQAAGTVGFRAMRTAGAMATASAESCEGARVGRLRGWPAVIWRAVMAGGVVFGASMGVSFLVLNFLTGNSLMLELGQAWAAHFAAARSFEYGSPEQYHFDWALLIKSWETTLPAALGLWVLLRQVGRRKANLIPIGWLILAFAVFALHKPWWAYYYIHNALPLCWLAGVGIVFAWQWLMRRVKGKTHHPRLRERSRFGGRANPLPLAGEREIVLQRRNRLRTKGRLVKGRVPGYALAAAVLFGLCAASWMAARVYLEGQAVQRAPKLNASLVLREIERFKPFTEFMFSDQPIYSFHADIPMPPHLAVLSLKRLWTGEMDNGRLTTELSTIKPGLILLGNTPGNAPFQELLNQEYRLVYQDNKNRLYAHEGIAKKPALPSL